ncbi:hypothetical protein Tco_1121367 [Tanacetum coccineum]|uniref:Protein TIC 214 n=1 Tax=Tanacetum coccineum TaxID=301880 RepID=A0ABQ5IZQ6_9ASTR
MCNQISNKRDRSSEEEQFQNEENDEETIVINEAYPKQKVAIGKNFPRRLKQQLSELLRSNIDIFAYTHVDMTGIPRKLAEHRLKIHPRTFPVWQKKRILAKEHNDDITQEVWKKVDTAYQKSSIRRIWDFLDGTLDDVWTALNDRLKGIRMEYLPQTFWSQRDKVNARAMIQAIDKRLKTRRIMRSQSVNTTAGNPVKKILLKLNLSDHRILKDGGEDFRYSDTVRLSRSDEVLKLKNFKEVSVTLIPSRTHKSTRWQNFKMAKRLCLVDDLKLLKITMSNTSSRNKLNPEINDHYNIFTRESQEYELKTKDEA